MAPTLFESLDRLDTSSLKLHSGLVWILVRGGIPDPDRLADLVLVWDTDLDPDLHTDLDANRVGVDLLVPTENQDRVLAALAALEGLEVRVGLQIDFEAGQGRDAQGEWVALPVQVFESERHQWLFGRGPLASILAAESPTGSDRISTLHDALWSAEVRQPADFEDTENWLGNLRDLARDCDTGVGGADLLVDGDDVDDLDDLEELGLDVTRRQIDRPSTGSDDTGRWTAIPVGDKWVLCWGARAYGLMDF